MSTAPASERSLMSFVPFSEPVVVMPSTVSDRPFKSSVSFPRFASSESIFSVASPCAPGQPLPLPEILVRSLSSRYSSDASVSVASVLASTFTVTSAPASVKRILQRESLADSEAGRIEPEAGELPFAAGGRVVPSHARVVDLERVDAEVQVRLAPVRAPRAARPAYRRSRRDPASCCGRARRARD